MAIQLGSAYGKIGLDVNGLTTGVENAKKSLGTLDLSAKKIGDSMQKIGGAMTVGLTLPIAAFFASSVKSAMDAESALAELEAVLKSTGGAAGVTADELKKMASELQNVTKFSDEEIMSGQSMLLTFTKIGKDVFPLATEAMLNMGEKFGSVEQAAVQLGKALNDPIGGVSALRRVGVMLTDEQEKQIKAFMAVNDIASAQKVILQELEVEFGGLARAAGDTTAGKFAQFMNRLDDFKEVIGTAIIPSLIRFMDALTPLLVALSEAPPEVTDAIIAFLGFLAVLGPIVSVIGTVISTVSTLAGLFGGTTISVAGITAGLGAAGTGFLALIGPVLAVVAPLLLIIATVYAVYWAFKNNFGGISTTVSQMGFLIKWAFGQIGNTISSFFNYFTSIITTNGDYLNDWIMGIPESLRPLVMFFGQAFAALQGIFNYFRSILQTNGDYMNDWIMHVPEKLRPLVMFFGQAFAALQGIFNYFRSILQTNGDYMNDWIMHVPEKLRPLVMFFGQAFGNIVNFIKNIKWSDLGKNMIMGLINGMMGGIPSLINVAVKVAQAALNAIKRTLGISSPSKVFMELGAFSGKGFQMGLANTMDPNVMARTMARPVQNLSNQQSTRNTFNLGNGVTIEEADRLIDRKLNKMVSQINYAMGGA